MRTLELSRRRPKAHGCVAAIVSLLLCAARATPQAASKTQQAPALSPHLQEVFNDGVGALQSGQLDAAEKAFLSVLAGGGRLPFVYNNLGIVYEERGDREEALVQFREAARLDPGYVAPHVLMGSTLLATGRFQEAARELERAARMQPNDPLIHWQLAKAYKRAENFLGVVEQLQAVRQLDPKDTEYVYQSARAYLDLSAWCFQQLVQVQPNSARAYQALGENFRAEGRPEIAIHAFQRAVDANPKMPEIHLALAQIYFEQGRKEEARKELDQELALAPGSAAALALKKKLDTP